MNQAMIKDSAEGNLKPFYNSFVPKDWNTVEFGSVFSFLKTFSFSREQLTNEKTIDEIRNIHYGDIHATYESKILNLFSAKNIPYLQDGILEKDVIDDANFPLLQEGDLIIADTSEDYEGICDCVELKNVENSKVVAGLHTFAARAHESQIALGFRAYVLTHEKVIREVRRIATGTSVYGVSKANLTNVMIALPPLSEQKSIAKLLGIVDGVIYATEKLSKQKEALRKWLIYVLLTGKKRLKGFEKSTEYHKTDLGLVIPLDWKIVKVKDIFSERKETSNDQSAYPLFSLTIENGLTEKTERYERSFLLKNKEENLYKLIYPNDILFNPMNLRFGAIAKSKSNKIVSVSAYYNSIYLQEKNADIDFFEALFKTPVLINLYDRIAIGSLVEKKRVHLSNFLELEIPLPDIKEQTAIAQVLQTAEKEASLLKLKVQKLRAQKKGLMQQLLTGKTRINLYDTTI
jgi:type I restriction enzyme, S subunit